MVVDKPRREEIFDIQVIASPRTEWNFGKASGTA